MAIHHHMKPGPGERAMCKIITVDTSNRKIEAALKDGGLINIAVFDTQGIFVWPQSGEHWTVRKDSGIWKLDARVDSNDDHKIDHVNPGEAKIQAEIIKNISGKSVIVSDDDLAENGQVLTHVDGEWVPETLGSPTSAAQVFKYYGAFSDYTDQYGGGSTTLAGAAVNVPAPLRFGQIDESNGISIVNGSRITFANAGIYNVQWSGQFNNTEAAAQDINVWLRKNGSSEAVVGSNGIIGVPAKHGSTDGHTLAGWNFVFTVVAGDYYEFMWSTSDAGASLQHYPGGTISASPLIPPSTASLVLTVTPV